MAVAMNLVSAVHVLQTGPTELHQAQYGVSSGAPVPSGCQWTCTFLSTFWKQVPSGCQWACTFYRLPGQRERSQITAKSAVRPHPQVDPDRHPHRVPDRHAHRVPDRDPEPGGHGLISWLARSSWKAIMIGSRWIRGVRWIRGSIWNHGS